MKKRYGSKFSEHGLYIARIASICLASNVEQYPCRALLRFGSIHDKKNYVTLSNVIHYRLCTKKLNVHLKLNECKQTFLWSSIRYQLESIITVEQSYNSPFFKDDAIDLPDNDVAILKKYAK